MNNLQALKNLENYANKMKAEQERINKEIMQQSLNELEQNLTNSFNLKMNTIENRFSEILESSNKKIEHSLNKLDKQSNNHDALDTNTLAQELQDINYEKLIKALFIMEKGSSMEDLNSEQIESILDDVYDYFMDNQYSSSLQEDINDRLDKAIKRELSTKNIEIGR